jgi:hypothetical protein
MFESTVCFSKIPVGDACFFTRSIKLKDYNMYDCAVAHGMDLSLESEIYHVNNNNGERDVAQSDQQTLPP